MIYGFEFFNIYVFNQTVTSGLPGKAKVYMQLSTLGTVDPVKGLLIYLDSLASYLVPAVMKNKTRRGREF